MPHQKYSTKELKDFIELCEDNKEKLTPVYRKKLTYYKILYKARINKFPEINDKTVKIDLEPNNLIIEI